jgi:hypothetical protein
MTVEGEALDLRRDLRHGKVAMNNENAIRNIMIGTQNSNAEEGKCGAIAPLASPLPTSILTVWM